MEQTAERIEELGLTNIAVYNYHSLGYRFYSSECIIDEGLKRVVSEDLPVVKEEGLPKFDVLVLDEQQDMTRVLYAFVMKLVRDSIAAGPHGDEATKRKRFVLLGDPRQELYEYNGADSRFLTLAPRLFARHAEGGGGDDSWLSIRLDTSYRLTPETAKFVNEQVLKPPPGEEIVAAAASGETNSKPLYLVCNAYDTDVTGKQKSPFDKIKHLLVDLGWPPESILILAPSVRCVSKTPVRNLANSLSLHHPVFISNTFDGGISQRAKRGKLIICTYHQSKGTEADIVIVLNFDNSYHESFNKNPSTTECASNAQFVGCTRAKILMILIHHYKYNYLPFIDPDALDETCRREGIKVRPENKKPQKLSPKLPSFAVTGLAKDLATSLMVECFNELSLERVPTTPSCRPVRPKTEIDLDNGLVEDVSDIIGTAIPAIFEWRSRRSCQTFEGILQGSGGLKRLEKAGLGSTEMLKYMSRLQEIRGRENDKTMTIADILFLANIKQMVLSGYINRVLSIPLDGYSTWVTEAQATQIYLNMRHLIPRAGVAYETNAISKFCTSATTSGNAAVYGTSDVRTLANNSIGKVWELKAGSQSSPEHLIQTVIYGAILERNYKRGYATYLVNALNGRSIIVKPKGEKSFERIVQKILAAKLSKNVDRRDSDEVFLNGAEGNFGDSCRPVLPRWVRDWMVGYA